MEGGATLDASVVVNASGPWFNKLNATAGVNLSTTALPVRIQVGHKWVPQLVESAVLVALQLGSPASSGRAAGS